MIWTITLAVCTFIYIISVIEIVGSHYLTIKKQNIRWLKEFMVFPLLFPPVTPLFAYTSYSEANEYYRNNRENTHFNEESFFGYLFHGRRSINEWYEYRKSKVESRGSIVESFFSDINLNS